MLRFRTKKRERDQASNRSPNNWQVYPKGPNPPNLREQKLDSITADQAKGLVNRSVNVWTEQDVVIFNNLANQIRQDASDGKRETISDYISKEQADKFAERLKGKGFEVYRVSQYVTYTLQINW